LTPSERPAVVDGEPTAAAAHEFSQTGLRFDGASRGSAASFSWTVTLSLTASFGTPEREQDPTALMVGLDWHYYRGTWQFHRSSCSQSGGRGTDVMLMTPPCHVALYTSQAIRTRGSSSGCRANTHCLGLHQQPITTAEDARRAVRTCAGRDRSSARCGST
jgi:hypothetical protein